MAHFYADENVPAALTHALRALGHDVLTAADDGRANRSIDDPQVLARAAELGRAVLTNNRDDFHRLHRLSPDHAGIVTFTADPDRDALAGRVHDAVTACATLDGRLVRVLRPA